MYDKKDRRRLYWLLDCYLSGKIDEDTFGNELHVTFTIEMDKEILTDAECKAFDELNDAAWRYSEYEEDHNLWPGFVTAEELKQKALETKEKLKDQYSLLADYK